MVAAGVLLWGCASGPTPSAVGPIGARPPIQKSLVIAEAVTCPTRALHGLPAAERRESSAAPPASESGPAVQPVLESESGPGPTPVSEYRIGPGDLLEFRSFDDDSLSQEAVVRYDGHISLPQAPDIDVGGCTRSEATERVRAAYAGVFRDPQVSLAVREARSKVYYVMGEVMRPSEYPYRRPIDVLSAINIAGGIRVQQRWDEAYVGSQGQLTKAFIIRHENGRREVLDCDLTGLAQSGPHASSTVILPDDVIYVPEGVNLVYVIGEVGRADVYRLVEGMTLLELLARAGWARETTARVRQVVLMREKGPEETKVMLVNVRRILKTGRDIAVYPGDVVYVPRKRLARLEEFVARFTGSISPLLSLYTQAYDAYYTRDRFELLLDQGEQPGVISNATSVLQTLRDFGSLVQSTPTLPIGAP